MLLVKDGSKPRYEFIITVQHSTDLMSTTEAEHLLLTSFLQMFHLLSFRLVGVLGICSASITLLLQYVADKHPQQA